MLLSVAILCLKILLLEQPMALDLRQVSAALKMITDLRRIGEIAGDMGDIIRYLNDEDHLEYLTSMTSSASSMVTNAINAFVQKDVNLARKVISSDDIIDNFNASNENKPEEPKEMAFVKKAENKQGGELNTEILNEIESGLKTLFGASDFKIHIEEVSKYDENSVYIKLDGEDCALLIGKEGYRYKALSSLLYNWINSKYNLNVRLEIAEFLKNQEAGMRVYLEGIIRRVEENGHAITKPLDGVLIKIALEQLRERFKDKYVGIKNSEEGKYIIINDFHSR